MSDQTEIVIASGARTPIGAFNGSFSAMPAHTLGAAAITAILATVAHSRGGRNKPDAAARRSDPASLYRWHALAAQRHAPAHQGAVASGWRAPLAAASMATAVSGRDAGIGAVGGGGGWRRG